ARNRLIDSSGLRLKPSMGFRALALALARRRAVAAAPDLHDKSSPNELAKTVRLSSSTSSPQGAFYTFSRPAKTPPVGRFRLSGLRRSWPAAGLFCYGARAHSPGSCAGILQ